MAVRGPFGELLVAAFPEFRGWTASMIAEEERFLASLGAAPEEIAAQELSPYELAFEFTAGVLAPALDGYPDSAPVLRRCAAFMDEVFRRYPDPDDQFHSALRITAVERLTGAQRALLRTVAPDLPPFRHTPESPAEPYYADLVGLAEWGANQPMDID